MEVAYRISQGMAAGKFRMPCRKGWETMFDFRIIACGDGTEIIDMSLKTPYNALTAVEMVEYTEMEKRLAYMERMRKREQEEAERKRKMARNPLYRIVCILGWIGG